MKFVLAVAAAETVKPPVPVTPIVPGKEIAGATTVFVGLDAFSNSYLVTCRDEENKCVVTDGGHNGKMYKALENTLGNTVHGAVDGAVTGLKDGAVAGAAITGLSLLNPFTAPVAAGVAINALAAGTVLGATTGVKVGAVAGAAGAATGSAFCNHDAKCDEQLETQLKEAKVTFETKTEKARRLRGLQAVAATKPFNPWMPSGPKYNPFINDSVPKPVQANVVAGAALFSGVAGLQAGYLGACVDNRGNCQVYGDGELYNTYHNSLEKVAGNTVGGAVKGAVKGLETGAVAGLAITGLSLLFPPVAALGAAAASGAAGTAAAGTAASQLVAGTIAGGITGVQVGGAAGAVGGLVGSAVCVKPTPKCNEFLGHQLKMHEIQYKEITAKDYQK